MVGKTQVLGVGLAVLDIVSLVDHYPQEDETVTAVARQLVRGGNVGNTLVVLSQLGYRCSWAGVLATGPLNDPIEQDLRRQGIDLRWCRRGPHQVPPLSTIVVTRGTGARTIVHYRDQREFGPEDFRRVDAEPYQWIHFEGRHLDEGRAMLQQARQAAPAAKLSLEVERAYPGIEELFPLPDLLFLSKTYALSKGYQEPAACLRGLARPPGSGSWVCAWGAAGAVGLDPSGGEHRAPAYPPDRLVDTRGAGDVFNAGVIDGCLRGEELGAALHRACRLAGRKCGCWGLEVQQFPP